jgi:hypothetical protein
MPQIPFIGPSYQLASRPASVQRTINMVPVPQEPGNERTAWVFKDVAGLVAIGGPPPALPVIGWNNPVNSFGDTAAHANAGTGNIITPLGTGLGERSYASLIGYTSGAIVWSVTWAPLASDPSPIITTNDDVTCELTWQREPPGSNPFAWSRGVATLTCSVAGVPVAVGQRLKAAVSIEFYSDFVWGPEP